MHVLAMQPSQWEVVMSKADRVGRIELTYCLFSAKHYSFITMSINTHTFTLDVSSRMRPSKEELNLSDKNRDTFNLRD